MKKCIFMVSFILLLVIIPLTSTAYAYTDPGSGMLLWQMLVSAAVGGLFYFRKTISALREKFKSNKDEK